MLNQQPAGIHAGPVAAVPTERTLAHGLLQRGHRAADALALLRFGQFVVLLPTPAVAADVVPGGTDRGGGRRVAFQREGAAEHRHRQPALGEQPHDPPEADTAAISEHALGGEVAAGHVRIDPAILGQPPFRCRVAVGDRRFRALLEIQDKVQCQAGVTRPVRVGWVGPVADQVAVHL